VTVGAQRLSLRKGLVMVQFAISQILIIGTLVVSQQMRYFQNKSLGFDKDAIVLAELPDTLEVDKLNALKNQLLDNPHIQQVSFGIGSPTAENNLDTKFKIASMADTDQAYSTEVKTIDADYVAVFDLQMAAGRALTQPDLQHKRALVNETLVKTAGFTQPEAVIGKQIQILGDKYEIIGVVKDFHMHSFHEKINPCVLLYFPRFLREAAIKIQTAGGMQEVQEAIAHLESVWNTSFPEYVFDYQFLDDYLATNYEQENKTFRYFQLFSALAILIGCLGLYGLISFMAEQKTKEVGIRKLLGASVSSIIALFSKEYMLLIGLAFLAAAPLAYYFMHNWLQNFAYRIDLEIGVFALGMLISIGIAFLTVGYKSYRAAVANPVESLKDE
jgi:ABC-type antimicrobial peptide transport system permease subunit